MDAQVPLVMALEDPGAVPGVAGGKGASLARHARAGFRAPPGFHVTTGAYLDFAGRDGRRESVLTAVSAVGVSDPATFDAAAARIGELFAGGPVPAPTAAAIAGAYACLGDDVPVAVRSSATAEESCSPSIRSTASTIHLHGLTPGQIAAIVTQRGGYLEDR